MLIWVVSAVHAAGPILRNRAGYGTSTVLSQIESSMCTAYPQLGGTAFRLKFNVYQDSLRPEFRASTCAAYFSQRAGNAAGGNSGRAAQEASLHPDLATSLQGVQKKEYLG